jgi:hypothetical protein
VVAFLLDLVYCSDFVTAFSDGDPPVPDVLAALCLAIRWQLCRGGTAGLLARHLASRIDEDHFPAICEAAVRHGLDELEHACVAWAHNNKCLVLCADVFEPNMYQGLSPEVRALLNPVLFPLEGHTPPPAKKRRISSLVNMFSAPEEPPPTP